MTKIAIIIPSRLAAKRLPNKPLKLIDNKEMILHVHDLAVESKMGDVIVASPDDKIIETVKKHGGKGVVTKKIHQTGTDRVYEVFENDLKKEPEIIINLQGDMPNLPSIAIEKLVNHMTKNICDIGTLASNLKLAEELQDPNVCKVTLEREFVNNGFSRAIDFYRTTESTEKKIIYHHVGIYAFTNKALIRYVSLDRSKLEKERKLEQIRALEDKMKIDVGYIDSCPLSVDTEADLVAIKEIMEK